MNNLKDQIAARINWEWVTEKAIPVLWLWSAFILIGGCVGVYFR